MPASAINSETLFLQTLWLGSLALSLCSLAIMVLLILRRMASERKQQHTLQRKEALRRCFYAALKSPIALTPSSLPSITTTDYPTIMQIALDLLRTLRGQDVHRITSMLELWQLLPYLIQMTTNARRGKCIQALTLLGYFKDDASLAVLLQHTSHPDMYMQMAALRGLAFRGAIEHIPHLLSDLIRSGQTNTLMLADILRRFGTAAEPYLLELAQSEAKPEIRVAGLMALTAIASLQSVETLISLINDPDANIRAQAIAALGKIGDHRASEAIAAHLEDDEVAVRVQAAQALGSLQHVMALPKLAARLADEQWWVRFRAAEALHRFGDKGIAVLRAMSTQENNAGMIARQVLGEREGAL